MEHVCMAWLAVLLASIQTCGQPINLAVWVVRLMILLYTTVGWVQASWMQSSRYGLMAEKPLSQLRTCRLSF